MHPWLLAALAAWQTFAVDPFKTVYSGHIRAFWAKDVSEPAWVKDTFAGLAITGYDGKTLTGEVNLWVGAGLDPKQCAAEVVWDIPGKRGVRVEAPTRVELNSPTGPVHAFWTITANVAPSKQIFAATAFVFCPIDAAHVKPPWGATFASIEMIAAGPDAKKEFCANLAVSSVSLGVGDLAGKKTMELGFACGVLPRLRGRDLVDDCKGDVLVSLDALGNQTSAPVPKTGTPVDVYTYTGVQSACLHHIGVRAAPQGANRQGECELQHRPVADAKACRRIRCVEECALFFEGEMLDDTAIHVLRGDRTHAPHHGSAPQHRRAR